MDNRGQGQGQGPPRSFYHPDTTSQDDDDQTWLDFLRSAGGTVSSSTNHAAQASASTTLPRPPSPRSDSSDRKRRLTTAEPGRDYPYVAPGSTRAAAVDMSTPPPRQQGHMRGHTTGSAGYLTNPARRQSITSQRQSIDLMPPPWQPDAEVTQCPVCEQEFTFLFRKHHCRKCGRVICANCSPHKITIPREYIVLPPGHEFGPEFGGAEVVRVCKPCVPDPWTPPAPQLQITRSSYWAPQPSYDAPQPSRYAPQPTYNAPQPTYHAPQPTYDAPRLMPTGSRRASEASQSRYHRRPSIPVPSTRPPPDDSRIRDSPSLPQRSRILSVLNGAPLGSSSSDSSRPFDIPASRPRGQTAPTNRQQAAGLSSSSAMPHGTPQPRRRQVREEDECPVCGIELPPGEAVREAHIQTCVSSRFSTPPTHTPPAQYVPSLPTTTSPTANTDAARTRAMSYRSRGIFPYIATEKDCVDGEGREQECTICMEEFLPGEEMGRLECLCKFHRKCIGEWWKIKGRGSCPIHVFNE
ncbi:hypothetical protein Q7P37_004494 [Cladosporium fusiforme]